MIRRPVLLLALGLPAMTSAQQYGISGTVLRSTDRTPVSSAHLTAVPEGPCASRLAEAVATDSGPDGRFSLALPCAALWRVIASAKGFPAQAFEAHESLSTGIVLTAAHPSIEVSFLIAPANAVTGTVVDEAGEAVRDAKVTLLATDKEPAYAFRTSQTDDRGLYEFDDLPPGTYLVGVQARPWYAAALNTLRRSNAAPGSEPAIEPELDVAYPITFFPATANVESATPLRLSGGLVEEAEIHLTPVPSIHLRLPGGSVPLPMDRSGNDPSLPARENQGSNPTPPILQTSPLGETAFHPTFVTRNEDGTVDLAGFAPGTYSIQPRLVRSPRAAADDSSARRIVLGTNSARTVDLAAASEPAEPTRVSEAANLSGHVLRAGEPVAGAMLLLLPEPAQGLANASREVHEPARQQSNTDGSFRFTQVPLGRYLLLALAHGWGLNWRDSSTLAPYLGQALQVSIGPGGLQNQAIKAQ